MTALALAASPTPPLRYDAVTIALHWLTALLVLVLFGTALAWTYLPRGVVDRRLLESTHVSLGILLAAVLVARLIWRTVFGRRLAESGGRLSTAAAGAMHAALYVMLAAQVVLGFSLRWFQGEAFSFFGLFSIPALFASNRALAQTIESLHNYAGWTLIVLAAGHAAAALVHHYVLRDGVLRRMTA